ncbi:MAG: hypothetical protein ACK5MI_02200 [Mangrovibacterium sp.]
MKTKKIRNIVAVIAVLGVISACNEDPSPTMTADVYQIITNGENPGMYNYQLYAQAVTYNASIDTMEMSGPLYMTYPMETVTKDFYYQYLSEEQHSSFNTGTYTIEATLTNGSTLSSSDVLNYNSGLLPSVIDSCRYLDSYPGMVRLVFQLNDNADGYSINILNADGNMLYSKAAVGNGNADDNTVALNISSDNFSYQYPKPVDGDTLEIQLNALDYQATLTGLNAIAVSKANVLWGNEDYNIDGNDTDSTIDVIK